MRTQFGYKIKLLATAKKEDGAVVRPRASQHWVPFSITLLPLSAMNLMLSFVRGNAVDDLMFYGKGAGPLPTGSAVMGDVIEIARAIDKGCAFDSTPVLKEYDDVAYAGEGKNKYYLKLIVDDAPGVLGKISSAFGKYGIQHRFHDAASRSQDAGKFRSARLYSARGRKKCAGYRSGGAGQTVLMSAR